ncbi:MAG: hypothetical protein ACHRHE_13640, partial [Tepidisphaerales bacterium]
EYPWDGLVSLQLDVEKPQRFALNLRQPSWCAATKLTLNGQIVEPTPRDERGYVRIEREWKNGDAVELAMEMPVQRIEAHPNIRDCVGKVALQRGPIVYGIEALDNGGKTDLELGADPAFEAVFQRDLLGGITVIRGKSADGKPFVAIPFYALANRGKSAQEVWIRQRGIKPSSAWWASKLYRPRS